MAFKRFSLDEKVCKWDNFGIMEENVAGVIESLKKLHQIMQEKENQAHKETQTVVEERRQYSLICIFPKKILRRTFLFLDFAKDIPEVLLTCKLFNSVVRSRTFQVLLHSQASNRTAKIFNSTIVSSNSDLELAKIKPEIEITTKEDAISQLKIASAGRDFLANKLKKQDLKIEDLNKEIARLQEEVKMQKNIHSKGIEKMNAFEKMFENEKKNFGDAQKNLSTLQQQYKSEIEILKLQIVNCEKDRTELQGQKKMMKAEVLKLREENQVLVEKTAVYQDVLNRIKAYFDAMYEAKLIQSKA